MRDNYWLTCRLNYLWAKYFADVRKVNQVQIAFSRPAKYRFGSIRLVKTSPWQKPVSRILINGLLAKKSIPTTVVDYVIAHELVHYSHGFSSILPKLHRYPHYGGVVNLELRKRGMIKTIKGYQKWLQAYKKQLGS